MNVDDPRLTAYALGEVSAEERAEIEKLIANSAEVQRFVNETQELAEKLRAEYKADAVEETGKPANLIDIRGDRWFWQIARPLSIAASLAILGLVVALLFGTYRSPQVATNRGNTPVEIETEGIVPSGSEAELPPMNTVPNPLPVTSIRQIQRVVIGELVDPQPGGEMRTVEIISDAYRLEKLRARLSTPMLSRMFKAVVASRIYQLQFLDNNGNIVARANFFATLNGDFVLQLLRPPAKSTTAGEWEPYLDYSGYAIPFGDWLECIGYSPSV